jgi:hypothetical protein
MPSIRSIHGLACSATRARLPLLMVSYVFHYHLPIVYRKIFDHSYAHFRRQTQSTWNPIPHFLTEFQGVTLSVEQIIVK